ncbi:MAG: hypothetical protein MN733_39390, partial [Nitrososphaera sp.]|nr:hypothetical protein [Nitrososphaera sp.]
MLLSTKLSVGFHRFSLVRALLMVGCAIYIGLFVWVYTTVISPAYSYYGFRFNEPDNGLVLICCMLAWLPSSWMPIALSRPSHVIYWLLYVLVVVPSCIVPILAIDGRTDEWLIVACAIVLSLAMLGFILRLRPPQLANGAFLLKLNEKSYWRLIILLTVVFLVHILVISGLGLRFVSLLDVYDVRLEYSSTSLGNLVSYSVNWLALVIAPLIMAHGLTSGRVRYVALGLILAILVYGLAAYKSVLFMPVLILATYFAQKHRPYFGLLVIGGAIGLMMAAIVANAVTGGASIPFLLVGRTVAMPGLLMG